MKIFIMAMAVFLAFACNNHIVPSNTGYQNREIVNEKGVTMLIGHNAPYMLKQGLYKEWFGKYYDSYITDTVSITPLTRSLKDKTIEVFLGSWCGDSKREVPRMLKILEQAGFDSNRLRLIFVDYALGSYKQSPQHEEKGKNIHHVPTIIIYDDKKELGRIVESPLVSLEKDLLSVLNENYIPNYKAILHWQQQVRNRNRKMSVEQLRPVADELKTVCNFWGEFNGYAYMLYASGRKEEAFNIFMLNTLLFPDKPGPFSSLGEYYFLTGDKTEAGKCYRKVLELKPDDAKAKQMLEQL
jgi:thiol-disulfide isomerase/thioredoxin